MRRLLKPGTFARSILLVLALGTLASCRVEPLVTPVPLSTAYPAPDNPPTDKPPSPTVLPSKIPVVTPTEANPTASGEAAEFTLTILHTGEVHGEVRPCG